MPGPYRVAIVPGGMTFLRTSAIAGKFTVRHCRGRRPRRPAGQAALCWLCVGRPAHRPPRTSAIAGKFAVRRPTYKPQKGRQRFPVAVMLQFFCASRKKIPHRPEQRTMGANAISRPLKRRRAKRQNGGAACYWQEPHRRGKQPVDGSRLVMVSRH